MMHSKQPDLFWKVLLMGFTALIVLWPELMPAAPVFRTVVHFGDTASLGKISGPILNGKDGRLYGLALNGLTGQIFTILPNGQDYRVLYQFPKAGFGFPYSTPSGALAMDDEGYLYGSTTIGGGFNKGMVFRIRSSGGEFRELLSFGPDQGGVGSPRGLMLGSDGLLYGVVAQWDSTTYYGGIFRMHRDGTGYAFLKSTPIEMFGHYGFSLPVEGRDGVLYGTVEASSLDGGAIYRMNRDGTGFSFIHRFTNVTNAPRLPSGGLIYASDGMLYGMFLEGLAPGRTGGVFQISPDGLGFAAVKFFNSTGYSEPAFDLVEGPDGLLYGAMTAKGPQGSGGLFRMQRSGADFQIVYGMNLKIAGTPQQIVTGPVIAQSRVIMCSGRVEFSQYEQFSSMNLDGSDFRVVLYTGSDGAEPRNPEMVATAADGTLFFYNATSPVGIGVLRRIDAGISNILTVRYFPWTSGSPPESYNYPPNQGLLDGGDGWMYNATIGGGINGSGSIARVSRDGTWELLYSFGPKTGDTNPLQVVAGPSGKLYGVTYVRNESSSNAGSIFSINRDGSGFTTMMRFTSFQTQGNAPSSVLTFASDGKLYGTTYAGGTSNGGVVFRINTDGTGFEAVYHFKGGASGANPVHGVTEGPDGFLYGVTRTGGARNRGGIYKVSKSGADFVVVRSFQITDGELITAASPAFHMKDGYLCGLAYEAIGRAYGGGGLYRIRPDGSDYSVVQRFDEGSQGREPNFLTQGPDGALYGTTNSGGRFGGGTVYSYGKEPKPKIHLYDGDSEGAPELSDGQSAAMDFGTARVPAAVSRTVFLRNSGDAPLVITGFTLPPGFSFVSPLALPLTLAPAAGSAVLLRMDAAAGGVIAGNVLVQSNDPDEAGFDFPVSGLATTPEIALLEMDPGGVEIQDGQAAPLDFGRNMQGTPGRRQLKLENRGSAPLLVSRIDLPAGYSLEEPRGIPFTVAAGGSQELYIALNSAVPGGHTGTGTIVSDDLDESAFEFILTGGVFIPDPSVIPPGSSNPAVNRQTGLREQTVRLSNSTSATVPACRLIVRGLPPGVELNNASAQREDGSWVVYVRRAMQPQSTLDILLEYYSASRQPVDFIPEFSTETVLEPVDLSVAGEGSFSVDRLVRKEDGAMFLEFRSEPGRHYQIEYSADGSLWQRSLPAVKAAATRTLWIDRGLPRTAGHPATESSRFYRVREVVP